MTQPFFSASQQTEPPAFMGLVKPWLLQGVLLICVLRGSIPFISQSPDSATNTGGLLSGTQAFVALTIVWIATLLCVLPRSAYVFRLTRDRLILLSIPLCALASTLWSVGPKFTLAGSFRLLLLTIVGIYIARQFRPDQQMKLFILLGTITAFLSLLCAVFFPGVGIDHAGVGHDGALVGIFTQKNTCGAFMLNLLTPALFLRSRNSFHKILTFAYAAVCLLMIGLSQSRTSWMLCLILFVCALALWCLRAFSARDSKAIAVLLFMLIVPVGWFIATQLGPVMELLGRDASASGRTLIWSGVFSAILKRPLLGYGYGGFFSSPGSGGGDLSLSVGFLVQHPHNGYLAVWLDLGVLGLLLLLLMLAKALKDAAKCWRRDRYADWYVSVILLVLLQNIDERGLANCDDISWLLFVVACSGLHHLRKGSPRWEHSAQRCAAPISLLLEPSV